jgi:uncharacterized membrane-anchored protein
MAPPVSRRRTAPRKDPESAALTAVSEQIISVQDEIARLAYFYWEQRGGNGGSAEEDWFRAEQELLALSRAVGHG